MIKIAQVQEIMMLDLYICITVNFQSDMDKNIFIIYNCFV